MIRKSQAEWTAILEKYEASQTSQRQFCQEQGIQLAGFRLRLDKWRKTQTGNKVTKPTFVAVCPPPSPLLITHASSIGNGVELTIGPINMKVYRDSDPEALRVTLQAVVEVCGRI